MYGG
jgi:hypothetical protein